MLVYNRNDMAKGLHVPRALDALFSPGFLPELDCQAGQGKTLPLDKDAGEGLPEAIHEYCQVQMEKFEVGEIS